MKKLLLIATILFTCAYVNAQSWLLTGNAGTNPSTNFVGTKDAQPLKFRTNNLQSGLIDFATTKANTSFGFQTLKSVTGNNNAAFGFKASFLNTSGNFNAAFGSFALYNNTTGYSNVAIGGGALFRNKTSNNTIAIGDSALYNQTKSTNNTAVGSKALYNNTTGADNVALGLQSLWGNTTGFQNTALGTTALLQNTTGSYNTSTGYQSLFTNQTGNQNTANGYQALYHNIASLNTATGYRALYTNTSGSFNTSSGTFSMYNNTTGYSNVAYGYSSLYANTTGFHNTATGVLSLYLNTSGYTNTATGYYSLYNNNSGAGNDAHGNYSLYNNTTGSYNIGIGDEALYNNTYGNYNVAVGPSAIFNNTGSYYNTAVGYLALAYADNPGYNNVAIGAFSGPDVNTDGVYNSVAIGEQCYTTASNQARIGNSFTTSIGGYVNWSNISDGRVKQNIKQNVPGLAFINKLNPVTYNLSLSAINKFISNEKKDTKGKTIAPTTEELNAQKAKEKIVYTGFVAQDVEKVAKALNYDFSGVDAPKNDKDLYGLRYAEFVVPLVKAVQELSAKNDALEQRIEKLESLLNAQSSITNNATQTINLSSSSLSQNIPNPFSKITTVDYLVPQTCSSAKILITNNSGVVLKQINLTAKGKGSINIDASTLASGAYKYALYVDERVIDSKQMVLAK